ncbi:FAD-dependent oxidoreductase [Carboxylicivirga linearis]|uniref:FAD-dependent oxidoreductase n=1 Tax=Carboxylicivirga linearis TaxID=1628157 RepID=A0ABS5JRN0_9BACT|nr:FAD-dependent oxidoreductase [Carboxylicivirga linearis]MBS2097475.1 FAD-dependent oxidoreductase [Carboxylicivirga linearis]
MKKTYVIVGGVAGGATTAARLRRVDENAEIIMLEKGPHISYANCGLPYYIGGVIKDRQNLMVQTPESFNSWFNIDIRIYSEVKAVLPEEKKVSVQNLQSGEEYEISYDKLILSPGASPIIPPIEGIKHKNIFTLRNVEDTDKIKAFVDDEKPASAVVVGAGFIGLEMAENLHHRGLNVTVVEAAPQVMNMLDGEMAAGLHQHFKEHNVGLYLNNAVKAFKENAQGSLDVCLADGDVLNADFIILSIGVRPDNKLAKNAGLKIGETGGVWVNEYLQTSDENIYAVGDSIEFPHQISKKPSLAFLAGPANKQGRILADNLTYGHTKKYKGSIGTAIAKVFDLTAGITGLADKSLKAAGINYASTIVNNGSHAGYYPGAMQLTTKISFCPETGRLYGAQIVGYKGVDKRLDILATIIKNEGTIYDLQEVEHAYAPPFSSAKDPVNQAGFNAENIMRGLFKPLSAYELSETDFSQVTLVDTRTADEFALGAIEGAINIPIDAIRSNLDRIPKDKKVVLYCGVGMRGYLAAQILRQNGYEEVYNLSGGLKVFNNFIKPQGNRIQFSEFEEVNPIEISKNTPAIQTDVLEVDACGLQCPGPIMKLKSEMDKLPTEGQLMIKASDPGFYNDVASWCKVTGNDLLTREKANGEITAIIRKNDVLKEGFSVQDKGDNKTLIVFSDDMDRTLASFVIANGAAAMGKKVTIFFTFWGLNVIKKPHKPKVKKGVMDKMFDIMMPKHSGDLKLSNMNMGGMGAKMMKKRMKDKKVDSLDVMIQNAVSSGINLIACQMSMDVMGVKQEELIDGVNIGGVANYLEEAEKSNVNLFI